MNRRLLASALEVARLRFIRLQPKSGSRPDNATPGASEENDRQHRVREMLPGFERPVAGGTVFVAECADFPRDAAGLSGRSAGVRASRHHGYGTIHPAGSTLSWL